MPEEQKDLYPPQVNDTSARNELKPFWRDADERTPDTLGDGEFARAMRWKEWQDKHREERYFELMKKATFRGTISAHLLLVLIGAALWIAFVAVAQS